jgi:alkylated DNA repair dioxygenase AlkB
VQAGSRDEKGCKLVRVTERVALGRGAWIEHDQGWIDPADADRLLASLRAELAWEQRAVVLFGRSILQPRLIAWAGEVGYRYSGQTLEPRAFTPAVAALGVRVAERTRVPFNHVLVNRYRTGDDSIGLHADDERELGDDPVVATVSLGATRRLILVPRRKSDGPRRTIDLGHGALFVMGGTCQRHYRHGIPREPAVRAERISLTFRLIRADPVP